MSWRPAVLGAIAAGMAPLASPLPAAGGEAPLAEIAFVNDGRIDAVLADGSTRRTLVPPTSANAQDSDPSWSPDGTQLAVIHERNGDDENERSRIDIIDADTGQRRGVTTLREGVWVSGPRWSPDGQRLVFASFTLQGGRYTSAIVIHELATGLEQTPVRQRLDRRLTAVGAPDWSPDGTRLIYTRSTLDRKAYFRPSLRTVNADGGGRRLLAREAQSGAFSPDGTQIAYSSVRDRNGDSCGSDECSYNAELYVMDAAGGNQQRLTRNDGDDASPEWSADGTRIAFSSNRNAPSNFGPHEIYSIRPDGRCLTWLTNGTPSSVLPVWHPTGGSTEPGGCGATPREPLVGVDLGPAKRFDATGLYWLGTSFRGALLDAVQGGRNAVFFAYEDCAYYRPGRCHAGIQLTVTSVCSPDAYLRFLGDNGERIDRRRGTLVADYGGEGGLMALAGGAEIHVLPNDGRMRSARRAFSALRRFPNGPRGQQLPPPAIPATHAQALRNTVRAYRRLDSIRAVAQHLGVARSTVRRRLRTAAELERFPDLRTVRC